jgi:hypothetical protein
MNVRIIRSSMLLVSGLVAMSQASAADLALPRDGWASWQVAATEGAPAWCCWDSWKESDASRPTCRLDEDRNNFGSRDRSTTDAVRMYARLEGGRVERLRVLSANCPVETKTSIHDLGTVAADDSARWLIALPRDAVKKRDGGLGDNLLAALAIHQGDRAGNALAAIARGDADIDSRQKAVFWLAMMRGVAGADIATSIMFNDKAAEVRKHAAFAITQSRSPRVAQDLIRLGNTDQDDDVRAQAWFWLAHTGSPLSEEAILAALRKDADGHVREQTIFALSQLPDDRGTRALIAVAEDRSLPDEHRKRAVFWLAQSESAGAQAFLDKVLAGPVTGQPR